MPKGEKILSPKQKDRTANFKKFRNEDLFVFTNVCFSTDITNEALLDIFSLVFMSWQYIN
jgi:hypothetical protein